MSWREAAYVALAVAALFGAFGAWSWVIGPLAVIGLREAARDLDDLSIEVLP